MSDEIRELTLYGTMHVMRVFEADEPDGTYPLMVEIDGSTYATALLTQGDIDALGEFLAANQARRTT